MDLLLADRMWTIKSGAFASGRLFCIKTPKNNPKMAVLATGRKNIPGHIGKGFLARGLNYPHREKKGFELSAREDRGRYQL